MGFRRDDRAGSLASCRARRFQIVILTGLITGCVVAGFAAYASAADSPTTSSAAAVASPAPASSQSLAPAIIKDLTTGGHRVQDGSNRPVRMY